MIARCAIIVAASLLVAADAREDAVKSELKKLEGTWLIVSAAERGKDIPEEELRKAGLWFTFEGTKVTIKLPKEDQPEVGTFTIDPTMKPKHIDMKTRTMVIKGVYALEGDTLKLCLVKEKDEKRPTDFTTQEGTARGLFVLQKEKK